MLKDKLAMQSTNINLLRFVCALLVIVCHSYAITSNKEDFFSVFNGGQCNLGGLAVAVFFFLSGLYVTKSLEHSHSLKEFLKKRCVRIFPQLWIVVLLSVFVMGPLITTVAKKDYFISVDTYKYLLNGILLPIHNLPGCFMNQPYATVNGSLWTMPVEFAAYIVLAVVAWISQRMLRRIPVQKKNVIMHIAVFAALILIFIVVEILDKNGFLSTVIRPVILFFEGTLFFDFKDKIKLSKPAGGLCAVLMLLLCKTPVFSFGLIILLPYTIVTFGLDTKQIKLRSSIWKISYEMYLLGWPIQQIVFYSANGTMSPVRNAIYAGCLDIVCAWFLYMLVEKLISIRDRKK